jgi:flagellar motor switch protein FliN
MDTLLNKTEKDEDAKGNLAVLMDVQLPVSIRFGETEMVLEEIVKLGVGSVIELNSGMDQPVELIVNNRILARGEVVTVDGFYGIRITEITSAGERFKSLNS